MIFSFAPVVDEESKILILGTMPSVKSLDKAEYYGHPQNQFWRIIYALFNEKLTSLNKSDSYESSYESSYEDLYEKKKQFLLDHYIGLWDVLESCEREGSSDSKIKDPIPNKIPELLTEHPKIKAIFPDSVKAEELFNRFIRNEIDTEKYVIHRLPSPSSARVMPFEEKLADWRIILDYL